MSNPDAAAARPNLRRVRIMLWGLVAIALIAAAAIYFVPHGQTQAPQSHTGPVKASFGGSFTLVGADGKNFSSETLKGKPYVLFFGFTRCGDVCPTTLARLVKLRHEAASDDALRILFITIDPANDGPKEVGQYAGLFNAPIIGLTGSTAQINQVKKQFGIYAEPIPNAPMGKQMMHTAAVLLFDRKGELAGNISSNDADADAAAKIKALVAEQ